MEAIEKALSNISRDYPVIAALSMDGGRTLLVVMESPETSRARRVETVRGSMSKVRGVDLKVYTPQELLEFRAMPDAPEKPDLRSGKVLMGSVERFLRWRRSASWGSRRSCPRRRPAWDGPSRPPYRWRRSRSV